MKTLLRAYGETNEMALLAIVRNINRFEFLFNHFTVNYVILLLAISLKMYD